MRILMERRSRIVLVITSEEKIIFNIFMLQITTENNLNFLHKNVNRSI